jgi:proteasome accessory factor B
VDVYGWASRRGEWLFAGWCHRREAVRVFYLSRVRGLKVNGVRKQDPDYAIPAGFDIRRWSRQQPWDYEVHPPCAATVRFRGSLARLARQLLPTAKVTTEPDGARLAALEVRNLRGLVRQALAWGLEAELVEPAEGRALARELLAPLAGLPAEVTP